LTEALFYVIVCENGEIYIMKKPQYRYNEEQILNELKAYVDKTYDAHYSHNKFQASEFIMDSGHGEGFCIGNVMKYAQRYGKKQGRNRNDLFKIVHYGIMAIYNHDKYKE
tara:strand:+ start:4471 stop:4800 length:330 start_codon:yes stop_codon:yes gene_type:complete